MLIFLLQIALAQNPLVIVVDISTPDAIYEDVSRNYAETLVDQLNRDGFNATRVDQDEMDGCKMGPCLGKVSYKFKADVVVTLDATEIDEKKGKVVISALNGKSGMPLALARGIFTFQKPVPKSVKPFGAKLKKELLKAQNSQTPQK
jgi:hypothetical protein